MTDDRMALLDALQKADDGNFLRALAETVLQILREADVDGVIGAGRYERSGERTPWRNGYRERTLDTRLGPLNLKIPKLRTGSYFPPFLEEDRRVMEANDEWQLQHRYMQIEGMAELAAPPAEEPTLLATPKAVSPMAASATPQNSTTLTDVIEFTSLLESSSLHNSSAVTRSADSVLRVRCASLGDGPDLVRAAHAG